MKTNIRTWLRKAGASVMFVGYIPFASGTFGSLAAVAVVWTLHHFLPVLFEPQSLMLYWVMLLVATAASIGLSSRAGDDFGEEDPSKVVVDEFVGQLFVFFMVPITWRTMVLGFLLFRFFDIVKPYPVCAMEEMEGGAGITMDDVAAGILANLCLIAALVGYHLVRGALT